jgi:midasin
VQEDEEDYQRRFPDQFAHFADLAPDEQPDTLTGASEAAAAAAATAAAAAASGAAPSAGDEAALQGAAALSVRGLVLGPVLAEIVEAHAACFGGSGGTAGGAPRWQPAADAFMRSYELGVQLLRAARLVAPAALDAATASGHLYAAACSFCQLAQPPPALAAAAAGAGVDMQSACVEEAVLVQQPGLALRERLRVLLAEWPEHPGLLQARACWKGRGAAGSLRPAMPRLACIAGKCPATFS